MSGFADALSAPFAGLVSPLQRLRGQPDGPARIDRIVFVPDGAIHDLPLAALTDARGRHVIEDFTVAVAPARPSTPTR